METLNNVLSLASDLVWNTPSVLPAMVVLLLFSGLFLTVRLGFIQFRRLGHAIRVVAGKYDNNSSSGDVSHYQALTSALSATVGIGNIAGVATAIHYGGPGAVFWLWLTGFLGMATKFVECTLAQKHRVIHPDGSVSGGPMYYIEKGLGPRWKWVAILFAVCAATGAMGTGNSIQAFTMADSLRADFGIPNWVSGLVSASIIGLVIVGGIRRIGTVTGKLVPFMGLLYVVSALVVVALNIDRLPGAVSDIVTYAFLPPGMIGGFAGSTFVFTLTWGVKRGLFSNEAGQGSAPIAHAAAKTDRPVSEGSVALLEPFVDTVVICFITGLVIVTMGTWNQKHPDRFDITAKSGLTWVRADAKVIERGQVDAGSLFVGTSRITDGLAETVLVVRNNSIVDGARFHLDGKPFSGEITLSGGVPIARDNNGKTIPASRVFITGNALLNGSPLTATAFRDGLMPVFPWGNYLITIVVFLFAISTAISWSYYGDRAILYLAGPRAVLPYKVLFTAVHFIGAIVSLEAVWAFGDTALGLMAIPNLIAVLILSRKVRKESDAYFAQVDADEMAQRREHKRKRPRES
ncbi:MAG TPA: sodium:alanine symporter family protein [Myxococcota bacterium]|nr:sodium:alanine symporter family protein [Myxococcota bacterium]